MEKTSEQLEPSNKKAKEKMSKILERWESRDCRPFIYVIKCGEYYKIGYTSSIKNRVASLKGANPHTIEVVISEQIISAKHLEKAIHAFYKKQGKHHQCEWFKLDEKDLKAIKRTIANCKIEFPKIVARHTQKV